MQDLLAIVLHHKEKKSLCNRDERFPFLPLSTAVWWGRRDTTHSSAYLFEWLYMHADMKCALVTLATHTIVMQPSQVCPTSSANPGMKEANKSVSLELESWEDIGLNSSFRKHLSIFCVCWAQRYPLGFQRRSFLFSGKGCPSMDEQHVWIQLLAYSQTRTSALPKTEINDAIYRYII